MELPKLKWKEKKRIKKFKKRQTEAEQSIKEFRDSFKIFNIYIIEIPDGEEKENRIENI